MENVILISGANRGIGLQIAKKLHSTHYRLSLGMREPEQFSDTQLTPSDQLLIHQYDAQEMNSAASWVEKTIAHFGRIDGLVNAAGILRIYQLEDADESPLDEMWDVNVKGTMRLTRTALPHLRQSGEGRIINIVSMSGKRVKGMSAGYAMTKYAQLALSHSMRNIGWEDGIRVTALCPSWVNTTMATSHCQLPPQEMTQPEDIAEITATVLSLPNNAVVNEIAINCSLETS